MTVNLATACVRRGDIFPKCTFGRSFVDFLGHLVS